METKKSNYLEIAFKLWPIAAIVLSLAAQWTILGQRVQAAEARLDRQGAAITTLQTSVADVQTQYAALNAKLDAVNDNVLYIRNRIDESTR